MALLGAGEASGLIRTNVLRFLGMGSPVRESRDWRVRSYFPFFPTFFFKYTLDTDNNDTKLL